MTMPSGLTRQEIVDKYKIRDDADPNGNPTDDAMRDGERVVGRLGWARRIAAWVDPTRGSKMYAIVTRAHLDLRAAMAAGDIEYDDFAAQGYPYDPDDPSDAAVLIHWVGSNRVSVCKRPQPGRAERGVPYHAGLLQLYSQVYDGHAEGDCQIGISGDCGGPTNVMVLGYGAVVLVFRCCDSCDLEARETAEVGYKFGVMAAHERLAEQPLPAWARSAPRWRRWWARVRRWLGG